VQRDPGITQYRVALGDEEIGHRIAVTASAPQADDMPNISHRRAAFRKQQCLQDFAPIPAAPWRAVRTVRHDMGAEPGGMVAAAGEIPGAGQLIPAWDHC
jgi:hypothetical protein